MNSLIFSICIPQYNKSEKLLRLLNSIKCQSFNCYEVCISDGNSTDDSILQAESFLIKNKIRYKISKSNTRRFYDENIRNAINLADGMYSILMGNDDVFYDNMVLSNIYDQLKDINYSSFGFLLSNFSDINSGKKYIRVGDKSNKKIVRNISSIFRSLSFVSGLTFNSSAIKNYSSNISDGSEMYQMYLASKLLNNDKLGYLSSIFSVKKDSPETALTLELEKIPLPMSYIPDAIAAGLDLKNNDSNLELESVIIQLYTYIYPYWMVYYKNSNLNLWLKFCISLSPNRILDERTKSINKIIYFYIFVIYYFSILISLIIPIRLFIYIEPLLHKIAKRKNHGNYTK